MNRKNMTLAVPLAAVAVLAAAYPASSWYLGRQIEAAHAELAEQLTALPYLKVIRRNYERGLFSASETLTIELSPLFRMSAVPPAPTRPPMDGTAREPQEQEAPEAQPAAPSPVPPLRVTTKTAIRHGPFPDFSAFAAASATTVVEFDEAIQKKVQEAFGGKPAAEIRTLYDFAGGGRGVIASPPFKLALPGRTEGASAMLSGDGLEMTVEFTRGMERYSMQGSAPRFDLSGPDGQRLTLAGLSFETRQQRIFTDEPLLYAGSQRIALAGLSFETGQTDGQEKSRAIALKELQCDGQTAADGEFINLAVRSAAAGVRVDEQDYGPAAYDFSARHLHARKMMALYRDIMALYAEPTEMLQDQRLLLQAMAPMKDKLVALLLDVPVFSIDRITFRMPEGEVRLNASARLDEAKAEDFANPLMLAQKLDAAAEVVLPGALAVRLANGKPAGEEDAESKVDAFVRRGYATLEDGMIKSRLTFKGGQLHINDQLFNPLDMIVRVPRGEPEQ